MPLRAAILPGIIQVPCRNIDADRRPSIPPNDGVCLRRTLCSKMTRHSPQPRSTWRWRHASPCQREKGYVRVTAKHPHAQHITDIITSRSNSSAGGCGVTWIN
ncbi:hypothetical protein TcCL_ESM02174 [Trypanosoma cruzi]|nr:hypothetical protein TcCL_ESM02174 [Trypanosoma cruzi]